MLGYSFGCFNVPNKKFLLQHMAETKNAICNFGSFVRHNTACGPCIANLAAAAYLRSFSFRVIA